MPKLEPKHAGCWFDCARGIYIGGHVMRLALASGWKPKDLPEDYLSTEGEHYHELTDEATDYLQSLAPEGYWVGFSEHGGDFGMWECEEETA